jgi:hypothetical protein
LAAYWESNAIPSSPRSPPVDRRLLILRKGIVRSDPPTTSKTLINPPCWTMKRRVESPEGTVMKTGELRLVLIG